MLRRLAPHPGGCTLAAAEAVCAGDGVPVADVAEVLGRLVDRSLVVRIDGTSGSRYRLLETVRAFAQAAAGRGRRGGGRPAAGTSSISTGWRSGPSPGCTATASSSPISAGSIRRGRTGRATRGRRLIQTVIAPDGTPIAVEAYGDGPAIVLVGGALNDRRTFLPLARHLAPSIHRGDLRPPRPRRQRDRRAVGGRTGVGGSRRGGRPGPAARRTRSGCLVRRRVRGRGGRAGRTDQWPAADRAAVHPRRHPPADAGRFRATGCSDLVAQDRYGDAMELFLVTAVEMPAEVVAPMRTAPMWKDLEALAPTLAYDIDVMGDFTFPAHWPTMITVPTLVIDGGQSFDWRRNTAQFVADLLPQRASADDGRASRTTSTRPCSARSSRASSPTPADHETWCVPARDRWSRAMVRTGRIRQGRGYDLSTVAPAGRPVDHDRSVLQRLVLRRPADRRRDDATGPGSSSRCPPRSGSTARPAG